MENVSSKTENNCSGCGACSLLCPQKCIKMKENERGFLQPVVDANKCINCGLCVRKCPYNSDLKLNEINCVYAAKSHNKYFIQNSTSGGIFREIATKFIENGFVVGAAFDKDMTVKHIIIEKKEDLGKLSGSKYVQSNNFECMMNIKKLLEDGKKVLYSGTGCQIAGLKSFLNFDYDGLYTIEIACHGIPSPGFFRTYLKWLENKYKIKITNFSFRTKEEHSVGEHYMLHIISDDGRLIKRFSNLDPFYGNFLDAKSLRKSCFSCKYKGKKRVGDLLLSDYWGIEKIKPEFDSSNGCSAVFISTVKGKELFDNIRNNIDCFYSSFEDAVRYNKSIIKSAEDIENNIFDNISFLDDINSINKIKVDNKIKKIIKNFIPEKIKKFIKKMR